MKSGVAPTDDYGIVLAELSGLPKTVTEKARKYASERIVSIVCIYIYFIYLLFIYNSCYIINTLLFIFYILLLILLCKFLIDYRSNYNQIGYMGKDML